MTPGAATSARSRRRALPRSALLLLAMLGASCREPPPPPPEPDPIPEPRPVGVNEVGALAISGAGVWVGTTDGVVLLLPDSGRWTLLGGGPRVSGIAVAPDGTAWSSHRAPAADSPAPGEGGVRALRPDGSVQAYFSKDGLPSDDVLAIAWHDGVAAATSGGLALMGSGGGFTPWSPPQRRRVVLADPQSPGLRTVTEFTPRGERVLSLAADASSLWLGTTHGLLAVQGATLRRVVLPSCRADSQAADGVVALAAARGMVVAAVAREPAGGEEEPSGVVEILGDGASARCRAPGTDVPAALTTSLATDGRTTWMATREGVLRMEGEDVRLLETGLDLPSAPPMAVASDASGAAWIGFWGAGVGRLRGEELTLWRFGAGQAGVAPSVPFSK